MRYSQRLSWSLSPNSISRLVEEKRKANIRLLDLTVSNPTSVLPSYPHDEINRAFACLTDFSYVPDPFGWEEARTTVSRYYQERGITVSPSRIAFAASTSEAYGILFKLLCDPGDEILIPLPSYPLFEYLASLESVLTVPYRLQYDGSWYFDFKHLRERISERSRAIVVVNPNNPTGSFLKRHELKQLLDLALEKNLAIISDEVFMDYRLDASGESIPTLVDSEAALSFSLNGLSKAAGMPQMKLAWIVINGPESERDSARSRLELLLDTYLPVNTPVQLALADLLAVGAGIRAELTARATANLRAARTLLKDSPVHVLRAEGGWFILLQLPRTLPEEEWILRLLQDGDTMLQPGYFFDMPSEAYGIASLITEPDDFEEGILGLRRLAAGE